MHRFIVVAGTIGLFTLGAGAALAQQTPKAAPAPATTPAEDHAHMQGMNHGGQLMHDQMMKDHQQGMAKKPAAPAKDPAAKMPMQDCCMDKPMAPKDKPMAPKDSAMPMKDM